MNVKIQGGGNGTYANTGSCVAVTNYLQHEDLERMKKGEEVQPFFNQFRDYVSAREVTFKIDNNKAKLSRTDAKFYVITVSPSEKELRCMGGTPQERAEALQYKAKNEVLEMEIPQLQEIAGKVWKKEDELKQLKSELAALDRKIQLELAPPTPEVAEKENEGQQLKPEAEDVRNRQAQYPENAPPQIRSPADSIVANHVIIGRPGLYAKEETRSKGLKI